MTSGPTHTPLDPFRVLTNRSTGMFGTLLAQALLDAGETVTMIYGTGSHTPVPHPRLTLLPIETNEDLAQSLRQELKKKRYDVVVHAAAVLDFAAKKIQPKKVKTRGGTWKLELVPTKKIITQIKLWSPDSVLVGFKLEFGLSKPQLLKEAQTLQKQCKADFIVANTLTEGTDTIHKSYLLDSKHQVIGEAQGKEKLVQLLLEKVKRPQTGR